MSEKIEKTNVQEIYELNTVQKGMLFHYLSETDENLYNASLSLRIEGDLDGNILKEAFNIIQLKNEALRSVFRWDKVSKPLQVILKECRLEISFHDISQRDGDDISMLTEAILNEDRYRRFDLAVLPLRISLIKARHNSYILSITHHHILYDGWSTGILLKELFSSYKEIKDNRDPAFNGKPGYKQVYQLKKGKAASEEVSQYWKGYLKKYEIASPFTGIDSGRSKNKQDQRIHFAIPVATLETFSNKHKVTRAAVIYAAFGILLQRYCNTSDVVFGTTVSDRDHEISGMDQVIGNFINTIPLRINDSEDDSFLEIVTRVNNDLIERREFSSTSYFDIKKLLGMHQRQELFDAVVVIENYPLDEGAINCNAGFQVRLNSVYENTGIPLIVVVFFREALEIELVCKPGILNSDEANAFGDHFKAILIEALSHSYKKVRSYSLMSARQEDEILNIFNDTKVDYRDGETIVSLFERQVLRTPDHIALRCGDETISYRQLKHESDTMASYLRHVLRIESGDLAGVMLQRGRPLIVSILAILKAGGAYVPIDSSYPAERINAIIKNAGLKILITSSEYPERQAQPSIQTVDIDREWSNIISSKTPPLAINSSYSTSLAYVLYTSGSTGRPKGVMIENRSLVNYICWAAGEYVNNEKTTFPLFTSISFDLTVTSIFVPLITGNEMLICQEDEIDTLIERIFSDNKVNAVKLTPSHLRILRDLKLPELSSGSSVKKLIVGGEELTSALASDIYKKFGGKITIYNEYGPTEATVGCMIHRFDPAEGVLSVPIGHPIRNTQIYILDNLLRPVPWGIVGELYISGDGVARGYLHNEELTADRFTGNPFIKGKRMYRTGDMARRLPAGDILFLGRADSQVKIRGFRIEPGEVEEHLSAHKEIKGSVVLAMDEGENKYLVAYYVADDELEVSDMRSFMAAKLPDHMVPSYYVRLEKIPLTPNGKLDKKALPVPEVTPEDHYTAPRTKEERLLSKVWSKVLNVDKKIGIADNLFSIGGDSIKAIQISSRMRMEGYEVSLKSILNFPTIKQLLPHVKRIVNESDQSSVIGEVVLSPIQKQFFEGSIVNKHHYNQSVLLNFPGKIPAETVRVVFEKIQEHHDALRMVFKQEHGRIIQVNKAADMPVSVDEFDLRDEKDTGTALLLKSGEIQSGIDLVNGPLMRLGLFHVNDGCRLFIAIHHLVVDGISWRILYEDIDDLFQQISEHKPLSLPLKTDSFMSWSKHLQEYAKTKYFEKVKVFWEKTLDNGYCPIKRDTPSGIARSGDRSSVSFRLDKEKTLRLLTSVHASFNTKINDILLTALFLSIRQQTSTDRVQIDLEGHGREDIVRNINVSRTVGWFTSIFPVFLTSKEKTLAGTIKQIKEILRGIPNNGIEYLLVRSSDTAKTKKWKNNSPISFNYLGQFDADITRKNYSIANEVTSDDISKDESWIYDWDIIGLVASGQLEMTLRFSPHQYRKETISALMDCFQQKLSEVIEYCSTYGKTELTPSDLTYKALPVAALEDLQHRYEVEDIYPLSPLQEGILFHSLLDVNSENYFDQKVLYLRGRLNVVAMERSLNDVVARYDVLRAVFLHDQYTRPLQVVLRQRNVDFTFKDVREECEKHNKEEVVLSFRTRDKAKGFDLSKDVMLRATLLQTADDAYVFIWSHHHIIMDGWCSSIIWSTLRSFYDHNVMGSKLLLPPVKRYSTYINWLEGREKEGAKDYWRNYLANYNSLSALPKRKSSSPEAAAFCKGSHQLVLNKPFVKQLHTVSRVYGVTMNTILQCAWAILLGKYNNACDVVFGSVISARPAEIEDIEIMVGLFLNTVPVRIAYQPHDIVCDVFKKVQDHALENELHQYTPLSEIQSSSELGRGLLDHIMIFENYPVSDELSGNDLRHKTAETFSITNIQVYEQTNYDLTVIIIPGDQMQVRFDYNTNVYSQEIIERASLHLYNILGQIGSGSEMQIQAMSILSPEEKHQLVHVFNNTHVDYHGPNRIERLFEETVRVKGESAAVVFEGQTLSYRALNERSNQLARKILGMGVKPEDRIGLLLPRSFELVISMIGVLKSGCAYVPLDPEYPSERIKYIMEDSDLRVLLTEPSLATACHDAGAGTRTIDVTSGSLSDESAEDLAYDFPGSGLAYLIYTSGSTGKPKGVMIEHRNVVNFIQGIRERIDFHSGHKILSLTTVSFDIFVLETFVPLVAGMPLVLGSGSDQKDPESISMLIAAHGIDMLQLTPSHLRLLLSCEESANIFSRLSILMVGGEPFGEDLLSALRSKYQGKIYNMFGPTETTVWSTIKDLTGSGSVTIGTPLMNTTIRILGSGNSLQPIGVCGELCIGGSGVGRGYWKNALLSGEKFIADPVTGDGILYRTGDLGRWVEGGELEHMGRSDDQLKLRGFRIEPGEIERSLLEHEEIKEALVLKRELGGYSYLVAYYVSPSVPGSLALREFLLGLLPEYMVPSYYVRMESFPLTPNGKLDRKRLPLPEVESEGYVAPRSPEEHLVWEIWREVLGTDAPGIRDNFFSVGGDSIKSIQISSRLRSAGYSVTVKEIFRSLTIESLALKLSAVSPSPEEKSPKPFRDQSSLMVSDLTYGGLTSEQLEELKQRYTIEDIYPLSPMQEGMLFHSLMDLGSANYFGQTTCQVTGDLDIDMIERSMNDLISRHDVLRTVFLHEGYDRAIQIVLKERKIEFVYKDIREVSTREKSIRAYEVKDKSRAFDLSKDVLMRLSILQVADDEFVFIWSHHHVLMDGWCMGIIVNEFKEIYLRNKNSEVLSLPPVTPYSQYIKWLESWKKEESSAYWNNYLASYDTLVALPKKAASSLKALPYVQRSQDLVISKELTRLLREVSGKYGVTFNTIFQCAWGILLAKYNNTNDVVYGTVVSGRPADLEGVETIVGLFINTIPVRIKYESGSIVSDVLQNIQQAALQTEQYHYHSLSEIQSFSELGQGLFDHIVVFENFPIGKQIKNAGISADSQKVFEITNVRYEVQTNYDLNITVQPLDELEIRFNYNTSKYEPQVVESVAFHLKNIISSIACNPDMLIKDIPLLGDEERNVIRERLTSNLETGNMETIQKKLCRSFKAYGQRGAIEYKNQKFTYSEIEAKANKIACAITKRQLPEGSYIGVLCQDRHWLICAILGILKSRGAFVPFETSLPEGRLSSMIEQVNCRCIITDQSMEVYGGLCVAKDDHVWLTIDVVEEQEEGSYRDSGDYDPEDPVYVYFTSGSTGKPKGVVGRNMGLSHFIGWEIAAFQVDQHFRFSQFTNPGFDVFMRDIFVPLCAGATICIPDEHVFSSGQEIGAWIARERITLIHCVPSFFKFFNKDVLVKAQFRKLKYILLAGEKILPFELKEWYKIFDNDVQLVNIYGPTETTLAKGYYLIQPGDCEKPYIPIRAMPGAQFLILDKDLNLCPNMALGEIYIRTPYRTAGYLNTDENRFVVNPFGDSEKDVIYRTGDLGRADEGEEIEIVGRSDHQVKIRGIRIELDDIRGNILKYPGIKDSVVVVKQNGENDKFICAYVVPEMEFDHAGLRAYLETVLPGNMVPSYLISLSTLPTLANGKVDRKALPEPVIRLEEDHVNPSNEMERVLLDIWSEVLKIDRAVISMHKSFFELGGHSLKVLLLVNRINKQCNAGVSLKDIFEKKSIQNLADYLMTVKGIEWEPESNNESIEIML